MKIKKLILRDFRIVCRIQHQSRMWQYGQRKLHFAVSSSVMWRG